MQRLLGRRQISSTSQGIKQLDFTKGYDMIQIRISPSRVQTIHEHILEEMTSSQALENNDVSYSNHVNKQCSGKQYKFLK